MVRGGSATAALFGLTRARSADKPIHSVVFGLFRGQDFAIFILFGCVSWVSFLKLKLSRALTASDDIIHLLNCLSLHLLELLCPH